MLGKATMVFIDGQNLYHGAQTYAQEEQGQEHFDLDLPELVEQLTDERDLIRSYYFDSYKPGERENKEGFYSFLELNGFRVEATALQERGGSYFQKGADIGLATELIAHGFNDSYDVAIVVTGDDDFSQAIRHVQNQGKIVEVASFEGNFSANLKRTADEAIQLDRMADTLGRD